LINRIDTKFKNLRRQGRKAFIAYVTAGFPSWPGMARAVHDLEKAGLDILEIGVPFSDPIADGPTIQFSSQRALERGVTLSLVLNWVKRFRRSSQVPVVLMSYLNPIHHMGYDDFCRRAADAGVDGLIVPDMIPEESGILRRVLAARGLALIHLVAPTTPVARQKQVARASRGFLYAVSVTGVTGARRSLPADTIRFLKGLRRVSPVPVALGFGISTPDQARTLAPHADGLIVGSALIERLRRRQPVFPLARALRAALDNKPRRTSRTPAGR
jgi:tryptophan synthase alpha chain